MFGSSALAFPIYLAISLVTHPPWPTNLESYQHQSIAISPGIPLNAAPPPFTDRSLSAVPWRDLACDRRGDVAGRLAASSSWPMCWGSDRDGGDCEYSTPQLRWPMIPSAIDTGRGANRRSTLNRWQLR